MGASETIRRLFVAAMFASSTFFGSSCASSGHPPSEQPADLARGVLETLRHNRPGEFMRYAFSPEEIRSYVAGVKPPPPEKRKSFHLSRKELLAMWLETRSGMRPRFVSIRARAEREGVHWPSVQFLSSPARLEMRAGRLRADYIDILFKSGRHVYRLRLDDCLLTRRGWLMGDRMIWRGRVIAVKP